jgi:IS30 family transposase
MRTAVEMRRGRDAYWAARRTGLGNTGASRIAGVDRRQGTKWRAEADVHGVPRPRSSSTRYLGLAERERIADGIGVGLSIRAIAAELGRAPSTVSRELRRNADPVRGRYGPFAADRMAETRARRPKPSKVQLHPPLLRFLRARLRARWSPVQISQVLRRDFGHDERMQACPETIYQAIYVQARGQLRRELASALRTGRAVRKSHRRGEGRRPRFLDDALLISHRPAEVRDRAVPGHWEGDLIIGANNASAIGTLVERQTRYCLLVHLPDGYKAEQARDGLIATIKTLPPHLRRSLTWDQGSEMARHAEIQLALQMQTYFCDPASPWQRGSNENTNGLLRQYFPKGTDLLQHSKHHLAAVAAELNGRPRKTLDWATPAEKLNALLSPP